MQGVPREKEKQQPVYFFFFFFFYKSEQVKLGVPPGPRGIFQISDREEESTVGGFAARLSLKSGESRPAAP